MRESTPFLKAAEIGNSDRIDDNEDDEDFDVDVDVGADVDGEGEEEDDEEGNDGLCPSFALLAKVAVAVSVVAESHSITSIPSEPGGLIPPSVVDILVPTLLVPASRSARYLSLLRQTSSVISRHRSTVPATMRFAIPCHRSLTNSRSSSSVASVPATMSGYVWMMVVCEAADMVAR